MTARPPFALTAAPVLVLALLVAVEAVLVIPGLRGAFLDEGIYVSAGLRTLDGQGLADGYPTWVTGSLAWPVLAALGAKAGGLFGARLVATACVVAALALAASATGTLFGPRARLWAAIAGATYGPVLALAHLAVYDALALLGMAIGLLGVVRLRATDDRRWLLVAACGLVVCALAKYPAVIFGAPPLVALLFAARGRRATFDAAVAGAAAGAALLVFFLADRGDLATFVAFRVTENPTFGVTRTMIAYAAAYFLAVPCVLALAGLVLARGQRRVGAALCAGLLVVPAFHVVTGNPVGDNKHVVFAVLFALPLIGLTLATAAPTWRRALVVAPLVAVLATFGWVQMDRIDRSWPDLRASIAFLGERFEPGDRVLANTSWPYVLDLLERDKLSSPYELVDAYRVEQGEMRGSLCEADWFVSSPGSTPWSEAVLREIRGCPNLRRVFSSRETLTGLGRDLRFITYEGDIEIWRSTS